MKSADALPRRAGARDAAHRAHAGEARDGCRAAARPRRSSCGTRHPTAKSGTRRWRSSRCGRCAATRRWWTSSSTWCGRGSGGTTPTSSRIASPSCTTSDPTRRLTLVRRWARDDDFWIRRIAILSQLGRGARLDPQLLTDVIAPNLADPEFFIRKAIGWALREYARVDPGLGARLRLDARAQPAEPARGAQAPALRIALIRATTWRVPCD